MRKLKLQTQVSVDGFCAGPNGEMDWMTWNWDDKLKDFTTRLNEPIDTILLGNGMAEGFIMHWAAATENPETADWFSRKMTDTPKVIFSHSQTTTPHPRTEVKNDLVKDVNALKAQPGQDIIAYGGAGFVSSLIENRLIDDYYLYVNPAVIGEGMPIFRNVGTRMDLELAESLPFECGIVVQHYRQKR